MYIFLSKFNLFAFDAFSRMKPGFFPRVYLWFYTCLHFLHKYCNRQNFIKITIVKKWKNQNLDPEKIVIFSAWKIIQFVFYIVFITYFVKSHGDLLWWKTDFKKNMFYPIIGDYYFCPWYIHSCWLAFVQQ